MSKDEYKFGGKWYRSFNDWSEAFDYCRQLDKPVRVVIEENNTVELWVLFPSGQAEFIRGIEGGE